MSPIADWYLNQLATHGVTTVLAVQGTALVAAVWAAWRVIDRRELRRDIRDLEARINHPSVRAHYLNPQREEDQ
jgi:hypothetical protein